MADIVYMAKAKWTALLDAIRDKSGKTDALTADTAKTAVEGIKAGSTYDVSKNFADGTATSVVIEDGITKIADNLFYSRNLLKNITLPDTITSIGKSAFYNCTGLVSLPLPDSITTIDLSAFFLCTNLALTSLPSKLTTIGTSAFGGCASLALTSLPSSLIKISEYAFQNCTTLAITKIPSSVTTIGSWAFDGCSSLSTITVNGPITFSTRAFGDCTKLTNFVIDYDHTNKDMCQFDSYVFVNTPIASGTGTITVPYAKWSDYKSATNLTAYASVIKPTVHDLATLTINGRQKINIYLKKSLQLSILYNENNNCPSEQQGVIYSIVSGPATVAQDGTVTVTDAAAAGDEIIVKATATYNSSISAQHTINVENIASSISIEDTAQWIDSGTTENGYKVYKSDSDSYNVDNGKSTVTLTITGYTTAVIYVKQSSEYNYDYVEVGPVDGTATRASASNIFSAKGSNNTWQKVTITLPDTGTHTVQVIYSKDSSGNNGDDRGYFYIAEGECS